MTLSMEQRLNRLEEQSYFHERAVEELHLALAGRQAQMDIFEQRLALIEKHLRALLPFLEEGGQAELPPHYGKQHARR